MRKIRSVKNEVEICRNKSKREHKGKVGVLYMFNSQFSRLTYFLEVLFKGLLEGSGPTYLHLLTFLGMEENKY